MSTDTLDEFMGVRVDPSAEVVTADLAVVTARPHPEGAVSRNAVGYVIDGRLNDGFRAVNLLMDKGIAVRRVDAASAGVRAGDFLVAPGQEAVMADVAKQTGVDFAALKSSPAAGTHELKRLRVGMYKRYYGGNIDEGWTRWLLEQWDFKLTSLMDADIKAGGLNAKFDVIILPNDSIGMMTGEGGGQFRARAEDYPPDYRSGFGADGVKALNAFVEDGGTLLTFGAAGDLPIERFHLPIRNVTANRKSKEFWCPGSTLHASFDNTNALAYGMPSDGLVVFLAGSQAYEILPTQFNERVETIVTFPGRDLLQSGWLLGEDVIAKKAAMVSVEHGKGRVILIGFRPQHRAQTHGTYKVVFNALVSGPSGTAAGAATGR